MDFSTTSWLLQPYTLNHVYCLRTKDHTPSTIQTRASEIWLASILLAMRTTYSHSKPWRKLKTKTPSLSQPCASRLRTALDAYWCLSSISHMQCLRAYMIFMSKPCIHSIAQLPNDPTQVIRLGMLRGVRHSHPHEFLENPSIYYMKCAGDNSLMSVNISWSIASCSSMFRSCKRRSTSAFFTANPKALMATWKCVHDTKNEMATASIAEGWLEQARLGLSRRCSTYL